MVDTTLNASHILGGLGTGALAQPARKRRSSSQKTSAESVSGQGIGSGAISSAARADARLEALTDGQIVEMILGGNQEVFAILVERYKDAVQNLAYRMLGNATEAEDVTQETFVRAFTQLGTYKPVHKFSTWLLSIASHLAIDQLRRRRFLALPLDDVPFLEWLPDVGVGPEQSALQGEQQ